MKISKQSIVIVRGINTSSTPLKLSSALSKITNTPERPSTNVSNHLKDNPFMPLSESKLGFSTNAKFTFTRGKITAAVDKAGITSASPLLIQARSFSPLTPPLNATLFLEQLTQQNPEISAEKTETRTIEKEKGSEKSAPATTAKRPIRKEVQKIHKPGQFLKHKQYPPPNRPKAPDRSKKEVSTPVSEGTFHLSRDSKGKPTQKNTKYLNKFKSLELKSEVIRKKSGMTNKQVKFSEEVTFISDDRPYKFLKKVIQPADNAPALKHAPEAQKKENIAFLFESKIIPLKKENITSTYYVNGQYKKDLLLKKIALLKAIAKSDKAIKKESSKEKNEDDPSSNFPSTRL